jgi:hypothetical protein
MNTEKGYHFVCIHTVQTALLSSRKMCSLQVSNESELHAFLSGQLVNGGLAVERMRNGQRWRGNTSPG